MRKGRLPASGNSNDPACAHLDGMFERHGMSDALTDSNENKRRRFLITASGVVGGLGVAAAAVPFIVSFEPSARAKAAGAPVEFEIGKVEPGQLITVEWRGKVCWVLNRTKPQLDSLPKLDVRLADPNSNVPNQPAYCKNEHRSIKDNYWIAIGICTHLGCSPEMVAEIRPEPYDAQWKGGYFCPCHKSRFDMSGRVFQDVPAPINLLVPPHHYTDDNTIVIGVDPQGAA